MSTVSVPGGRRFHEAFQYGVQSECDEETHIDQPECNEKAHINQSECNEETYINQSECNNQTHTSNHMFSLIRNNIIGKSTTFNGAYGQRKVLYCDYTASGRSLEFIENYIGTHVLTHYGNTHTTTSVTSLQTTMFRQESRDIIRRSVNASENNVVIFTGTGCTAAVHKLIHSLCLTAIPIVFVSPYEHHSNLLPWKEIGSKIVWVAETENGDFDYHHLEDLLLKHKDMNRPLIGCIAAASNVTGILVDTEKIAHILHKYDGLVFFDYATAGPYVDINMNPTSQDGLSNCYKDAVFISTHKFVGGPGCPGILVARKDLFVNSIPSNGGGGTVFFVSENTHRYLKDIEMREEGGTPDIVGSIRAGLVFQLKDLDDVNAIFLHCSFQNVGVSKIHERDQHILKSTYDVWSSIENLILLGPSTQNKLPIFSFVIKHRISQRLLHHNYVAVLLNDLFGVQSRGGCACAGPYAQRLLGMNEDIALQIEDLLLEDQFITNISLDRHHLRRYLEYSDKEILRPGFTRLNLPYFLTDDEISFVLKAVTIIAEDGWKLLPQYLFNPETGEWKKKDHKVFKDRKWLGSIKYTSNGMQVPETKQVQYSLSNEELLLEAKRIISNAEKQSYKCGDQTLLFGEKGESLRWFLLPCESQDLLTGKTPCNIQHFQMPFYPGKPITNKRGEDHGFNANHVCTCSPYKKNISKYRIETREENRFVVDESCDGGVTNNNIESDEKTLKSSSNQVKNGETSNSLLQSHEDISTRVRSENENSDSCRLVCKPTRQRKPITGPSTTSAVRFHNPPKTLFGPAIEGIEEFQMIQDGDCVLLCLSGGKDSLSMLHIIHQYKYYAKNKGVNFEYGAMTVDPQSSGYDPSPMIGYLKALNVPYFYEEQGIIAAAANLAVCESICSFCSRMKRGRIYSCARREKYNVVALGQHLDDIAESFLMSTFHNGYLRSMKANYMVTEGDLRVIRPLIYVREKNLRVFAETTHLPVIRENCPACFEAPKERHRMKQLLAQQEVLFPNLFQSLRSALHPLVSKDKTGMEKRNLDEVVNYDGS